MPVKVEASAEVIVGPSGSPRLFCSALPAADMARRSLNASTILLWLRRVNYSGSRADSPASQGRIQRSEVQRKRRYSC